MVPQLLLSCFSCGVLHTGFDVHIKFSPQESCTVPTGDFPSHLVQALLVDFLGLGGGEGGAFVGGLPLEGVVKHVVDNRIALETSPGMADVVGFRVHC